MNLKDAKEQLRQLRDDAHCEEMNFGDTCQCERFDQIIDMMDDMENQFRAFLSKVADPKHSDGEGLAKIPQEIPDEYLSDGEMLDMIIELLEGFDISIDEEASKLSKVMAVDTNKWANNALHVARFGYGASSGERASYYGLPMLYDALMELSSLDPYHRAAAAVFVTDWANGTTKKLWATLQEMYRAHDLELARKEKEEQR